jgi:hypothetical protein
MQPTQREAGRVQAWEGRALAAGIAVASARCDGGKRKEADVVRADADVELAKVFAQAANSDNEVRFALGFSARLARSWMPVLVGLGMRRRA